MKALKKPLLIGAAAIVAIGLAGAAVAGIKHSHVMRVRLPDGTLEEIRYTGDAPPVVRLQPGWAPIDDAWPADVFGAEPPIAALERLSAQVDREAEALFQQARSLPGPLIGGPGGLTQVDLGGLPHGMSGYSVVSTVSGGRVCTRTVEYGPSDSSGRLKALTRISGDCDGPTKAPSSPVQAVSPSDGADHPLLQQVSAKF